MKKLSDKLISLICCIAMVLITCFGISYKMANKTYAEDLTPITNKQRLGAFLSSLAFSCGVRFYIATVGTYEWLVDNFNNVMLRLQFSLSASDVYQNALDNFDNENKTYKLDPEFTKAVQEYLKYLQSEGINEYSGTVEIGQFEQTVAGTYTTIDSTSVKNVRLGNNNFEWKTESGTARGCINTNGSAKAFSVYVDNTNTRVLYRINGGSWQGLPAYDYYTKITQNGKNYYCKYYSFGWSEYNALDFPVNMYSNASSTQINNNSSSLWYTSMWSADAISGGTETIPVNGSPNPYWSATEITLDRDAEYTVDYSETEGADETSTLDELIQLINELIDTGTQEQQETIPQVDVQIFTPTIDPTIVDIPTLFDGIPQIVSPECVGLGSCLISGVQTASQHLQNIYDSNSNVANYTMVSLAIGIALYIITGGI